MSVKKIQNLQKELFLEVRDIPFEIVEGTSLDYKKAIETIKIYKKGSCTPKHFYLGWLYHQIGLKVKYITYVFYWSEQEFLNKELRETGKNLPEQYHLALEVEGKPIDATFDMFLAPIFPVNEFENCKTSVLYIDRVIHYTPEERIEFIRSCAKNTSDLKEFYKKLNSYVNEVRNKNMKTKISLERL